MKPKTKVHFQKEDGTPVCGLVIPDMPGRSLKTTHNPLDITCKRCLSVCAANPKYLLHTDMTIFKNETDYANFVKEINREA